MRYRLGVAIAFAVLLIVPASAGADPTSLYQGPGPRPGPDILYDALADAPQLENTGTWNAAPILVSGATAYRGGEFLYQDWLYDDSGARGNPVPNDPRIRRQQRSRARAARTSTRPTPRSTANNAADLVELRVEPLATDDRIPHHAQHDQGLERRRRDDRDRRHAGRRCAPGPTAPTCARPRSTS